MRVTVCFLGPLADAAGTGEMALQLAGPATLAGLFAALPPALAEALATPRIKLAVNGALVTGDGMLALADGDELAFLPPVSGG